MAHWIKPNISIDFFGKRRLLWIVSALAICLSIGVLIANSLIRGQALNYGTDFKGGSQLHIKFSRSVDLAGIRAALSSGGFRNAEVVKVGANAIQGNNTSRIEDHLFMVRLTDVSSFSTRDRAAAKKRLEQRLSGGISKFDYKDGSDKFYVTLPKTVVIDSETRGNKQAEAIKLALEGGKVAIERVQLFGRPEDRIFEAQLGGLGAKVRRVLDKGLGAGVVSDIPQVETVGAKMGAKLRDDGIKSVVYALILMLVYIAIRFDFRYAPGAIVALAHDVIITVGIFSLAWIEFSLPVVAALLTIAGYSINDTIVVYDRIRENVLRLRDRKLPLVVNASVNETLSRTLLTSLTTLFTCVAIWIMGTGVLKTFAVALITGVIVGTYSSIFIASPLVVYFNDRFSSAAPRKVRAR